MPRSRLARPPFGRPLPILLAMAVVLAACESPPPAETPDVAQEQPSEPPAEQSVFHDGAAIPWGEYGDDARFAPLYGNSAAEGEAFAFRLEVRPGFEMGPHTHPVTEHLTVLSGEFWIGMGETMDRETATAYGPGSYIAIAADAPAYMWAEEETVIQVHGVGPFATVFLAPPQG